MNRRQLLISIFATITFVATTWLYGGHEATMLLISLALSAGTFAWLFLPTGEFDSRETARENLRRLIAFPLFWIGLALFAYIGVQIAFPSHEMLRGLNDSWVIVEIFDNPPPAFVPTSILAPFGFDYHGGATSAPRQLCILLDGWLMLCALWCGLRERKFIKTITLIFIANALLCALFGIVQQATGTSFYLGQRSFHFGPFFYTNHAAEFFALNIALCAGTALRSWRESALAFRRGGIYLPLVVCALFFIIAAFATKSVGGTFAAVAWIPLGIVLIFASNLFDKKSFIMFAIFAGTLFALGSFWFCTTNLDKFFAKVESKIEQRELPDLAAAGTAFSEQSLGNGDNPVADSKNLQEQNSKFSWLTVAQGDRGKLRRLSREIFSYNPQTGDFWRDHHAQIFGWGAGSYRWISTPFQYRNDEFVRVNRRTGQKFVPTIANYAHCDIWNMLCEWGVAGTAIFLAGTLWLVYFALRNLRRWRVSSIAFLAGTLLFACHSFVDFLIYSPFLLLTIALLLANFKLDLSRERDFAGTRERHEK